MWLPESFLRTAMEHTQETPVKGIGAAVVLPGATIFITAVTELQLQVFPLPDNVFSGSIDNNGVIVPEHNIYGVNKVLPVPVAEGFLELRY